METQGRTGPANPSPPWRRHCYDRTHSVYRQRICKFADKLQYAGRCNDIDCNVRPLLARLEFNFSAKAYVIRLHNQWRIQDLRKGGMKSGGRGDGSPPVGSRGKAPVGGLG